MEDRGRMESAVMSDSLSASRRREAMVDELFEHGPMLLAAARMITLDNDEAEDLVQVTYEIAIRHIDSLREPLAMRAWLLQIESREAFRVVRRLGRLVSLDGHVRELTSPDIDVARRTDVRQALAGLPRRTRAAIAIHYLADLSVRETAIALGVTENTVKSQLRTGLARLREGLRDD
jgi:RNA polymerase sigma factor (sigma-70 family)